MSNLPLQSFMSSLLKEKCALHYEDESSSCLENDELPPLINMPQLINDSHSGHSSASADCQEERTRIVPLSQQQDDYHTPPSFSSSRKRYSLPRHRQSGRLSPTEHQCRRWHGGSSDHNMSNSIMPTRTKSPVVSLEDDGDDSPSVCRLERIKTFIVKSPSIASTPPSRPLMAARFPYAA